MSTLTAALAFQERIKASGSQPWVGTTQDFDEAEWEGTAEGPTAEAAVAAGGSFFFATHEGHVYLVAVVHSDAFPETVNIV